ncbi:MAG: hypothetical protein O2971_13010 [Proteobacteria bacterium]|nr:hypothetical protein [Pseudomonadota bacterium]
MTIISTPIDHRTYLRPLLIGFGAGILLFAVSLLGLAVAMVEFLRPVLIPGINLVRVFAVNPTSTTLPILAGIVLNGVIFALFFTSFSLISQHFTSPGKKRVAIIVLVLSFLLVTGMANELYGFWNSSNKSWIWQLGA